MPYKMSVIQYFFYFAPDFRIVDVLEMYPEENISGTHSKWSKTTNLKKNYSVGKASVMLLHCK
jgi:hypothetical protein